MRADENPSKQRPDVSVQLVGLRGGHSVGSTSAEAEPIGMSQHRHTCSHAVWPQC